MISAVAARKAALAQTSQSQPVTPPAESPTPTQPKNAPSSSKRKSPSFGSQGSSTRQKRVKLKGKETKEKKGGKKTVKGKASKPPSGSQRYFATSQAKDVSKPDLFEKGDDVIELDSDSGSESDSSRIFTVRLEDAADDLLSSGVDSDSDVEDETIQRRSLRSKSTFGADDSMDVDVTQISLSTLFPHTASGFSSNYHNAPISTFRPVIDENVFPLSVEEVSRLKLPPAPSSSHNRSPPSTVVLLSPHEALCLLGTCNLTVLHGSISILGSTLYPSTESHRIYAPKSSPLPVIRCSFGKSGEAHTLLPDLGLPPRIIIEEDITRHGTVLLFQESKTGIEGLGRICRPFRNAFEHSKWQSQEKSANAFKLSGLSLVRHLK